MVIMVRSLYADHNNVGSILLLERFIICGLNQYVQGAAEMAPSDANVSDEASENCIIK